MRSFQLLGECPVCGCEILIDVLPVDEYPEIGTGCELEIHGTTCACCGPLIGGEAEVKMQLEEWDEEDGCD